MNHHYIRDENCPPPTADELKLERRCVTLGLVLVLGASFISLFLARYADAAERSNVTTGVAYDLIRSGQFVRRALPSEAACDVALIEERALHARTKTSGSERWVCREDRWTNVSYGPNPTQPATCPPAPTRQQTCPAGSSGSWTETASVSPAPACVVTWPQSSPPAGSCTPIAPSGTANLRWEHDGANVSHFVVQYGIGNFNQTRIVNPSSSTLALTNLPAGEYSFRVVAYNVAVASNPSNVVTKVVR